MKGVGIAHPVQGLICPHGYSDTWLRLYPVEAVYVSMAALETRVEIEFFPFPGENILTINGQSVTQETRTRIESFLESFGQLIPSNSHFILRSDSNVPADVGLGSSSSAFAAITLAVNEALGASLPQKDLSILARHGSCSAAGAVVGGVSVLRTGIADLDGYASRILDPEAFPFNILIINNDLAKSSNAVHEQAVTSPLFDAATKATRDISTQLQRALVANNWRLVGSLAEQYLFLSYAVIMTGNTNLLLWNPETVRALMTLRKCRERLGMDLFFSMNTGSSVYAYTRAATDVDRLKAILLDEGFTAIVSTVGGPACSIYSNRATGP